MPVYRLFCLARPGLATEQQAAVIRTAALAVLDGGGVLMDVQSYGEKPLAYPVRPTGQRFDEAHMWQLYFHSHPKALQQLDHGLKVDERVIRHLVTKHSLSTPKPSTAKVAKWATTILDREYAQKLQTAQRKGSPLWWDHVQPQRPPLAPLKPLAELLAGEDVSPAVALALPAAPAVDAEPADSALSEQPSLPEQPFDAPHKL